MRSLVLAVVFGLTASAAVAQDWGRMATISTTMGVSASRICVGEASRGDIGCPAYAPSLTTAGDLAVSGSVTAAQFIGDGSGLTNLSVSGDRIVSGTLLMLATSNTGYISLSTAGTNWGYFGSGLSYLPILSATTVGVSDTLNYAGQNVQTIAGGGGNYIVSATASVSTSSANGGTIKMATGSGLVMAVSGSSVGIGTSAPAYPLDVSGSALRIGQGSSVGFMTMNAGSGTYTGYNGFYTPAGTRMAYIGFGHTTQGLLLVTEQATPLVFKISASEAMRIDSSGNVGIGTSSPAAKLHIGNNLAGNEPTYRGLLVVESGQTDAAANGIELKASTGGSGYGYRLATIYDGGSNIDFRVQSRQNSAAWSNSFVIAGSSGNVGIGTSAPLSKLHVTGSSGVTTFTGGTYLGAVVDGANSSNDYSGLDFKTRGQNVPTARIGAIFGGSGSKLQFGTSNNYSTGITNQAMIIDYNGNVGIGTTGPAATLQVIGAERIGTAANYSEFGNNGATNYWSSVTHAASIFTGGSERVRIDTSGNVGIGTTNPGAALHVVGANTVPAIFDGAAASYLKFTTGGTAKGFMGYSGSGSTGLSFLNAAGTVVNVLVTDSGNVGIGTTGPGYTLHVNGSVAGTSAYNNLSDRRFKKDIVPAEYGLGTIEKLRPVTFNWISPTNPQMRGRQLGLIAQEVQPLVPEAVSVASDPSHTMSIAYGTLVPVLIKAVQELKADNDNLQRQINELKAARK